MSTLAWVRFCYPYVAPMRVNNNTHVKYQLSHVVSCVTHMPFQCMEQAIKCWISTLPWGQLCYPYVAPMHVKTNTNVEYWSDHRVTCVTHMPFSACKNQYECWISTLAWGQSCCLYVVQCVLKTTQILNVDPPMGSVVLPICRSTAYKKHTHVEYWSDLLPVCCSMRVKSDANWISALPQGQFCYPYVDPTRVKNNTNVQYWSTHGVSFVIHMVFQCI